MFFFQPVHKSALRFLLPVTVLSFLPGILGVAQQDPERIPFGDDLSPKSLNPGRYDPRVTMTDNVSKAAVSRSIDFEVQ